MNKLITRFSRNLLLLTLILGGIALVLYVPFPALITPSVIWILPFFLATTFLQFYILVKNSDGKPGRFINLYMAASLIKLLVLLSVITVFALLFRSEVLRFAITLFLLYVVYTLFEVLWLLKLNRKEEKGPSGS